MTLMMGSEVAGSASPFEVSLAFWPARLGRAGRLGRIVLAWGWASGLLSSKTSEKPLPWSERQRGTPRASGDGDYTSVLTARGFGKLSRSRPWRLTV